MTDATPTRGEIWWVAFGAALGSEANTTRRALVLSSDLLDHLPLRIVVPLTAWHARHERRPNKVRVPRTDLNGLAFDSAADVMLVRGVAAQRFEERIGTVNPDILTITAAALAVAVDYEAR